MPSLFVTCPYCGTENNLGEKVLEIYNSSFAFSLDRKCVNLKCGLYFDETDTHEDDYTVIS